jgi:hypothetical protein
MAKSLYPEFLTSLAQYAAVRRYWPDRFYSLIPESEREDWKIESRDSELFCLDGESTTVLGALNRRKRKGVSVVQARPSKGMKKISAWTDTFGANYYRRPIIFLKIWCELTEESGELAMQLMAHWLMPGMTRKKMETVIENLIEAAKQPKQNR